MKCGAQRERIIRGARGSEMWDREIVRELWDRERANDMWGKRE